MQFLAKGIVWGVLSIVLTGCFGAGSQKPLHPSICEILDDNDEWIEPSLRAKENYGTPVFLSLALLELPLSDLDKKHVRPRTADWDEYRIRSERWDASPYEPADAVDFAAWFASETSKRNKISWGNVSGHYLSLRLGHGSFARFEKGQFPQLEQQAQQVSIRAQRWERELAGCKDVWLSEGWLNKLKLW
ncbi:hypothetical protein [Neptuniibacter caesariensis]|uniref:Transglycosylase SLT domain-containing protein n=1 Tax=Neptuniibacter caesariensis TaxID=207954 RepID=A0A7U8C3H3_NEPCE|nr:hypothetical protein [Neptuniibacter caesariensis]EAR60539.1 hypothetical protein MED92_16785 [Oceanospirillum sp. MED92] [Neptuniibacter caesariensis]